MRVVHGAVGTRLIDFVMGRPRPYASRSMNASTKKGLSMIAMIATAGSYDDCFPFCLRTDCTLTNQAVYPIPGTDWWLHTGNVHMTDKPTECRRYVVRASTNEELPKLGKGPDSSLEGLVCTKTGTTPDVCPNDPAKQCNRLTFECDDGKGNKYYVYEYPGC